jgi:hypothetical protein
LSGATADVKDPPRLGQVLACELEGGVLDGTEQERL